MNYEFISNQKLNFKILIINFINNIQKFFFVIYLGYKIILERV